MRRLLGWFGLLVCAVLLAACTHGGRNEVKLGATQDGVSSLPGAAATPVADPPPVTTPGTTLTANPNPIPAAGAATGQTTIAWTTTSTQFAEIHIGKPDGTLFCQGGPSASCATGNWVSDGQTFYLQNSSAADPKSPAATLATVTVHLR